MKTEQQAQRFIFGRGVMGMLEGREVKVEGIGQGGDKYGKKLPYK